MYWILSSGTVAIHLHLISLCDPQPCFLEFLIRKEKIFEKLLLFRAQSRQARLVHTDSVTTKQIFELSKLKSELFVTDDKEVAPEKISKVICGWDLSSVLVVKVVFCRDLIFIMNIVSDNFVKCINTNSFKISAIRRVTITF